MKLFLGIVLFMPLISFGNIIQENCPEMNKRVSKVLGRVVNRSLSHNDSMTITYAVNGLISDFEKRPKDKDVDCELFGISFESIEETTSKL